MAQFGPEAFSLRTGTQITLRSCAPHDAHHFERFVRQATHETDNALFHFDAEMSLARVAASWRRASKTQFESYLGAFTGSPSAPERMVGQLSFLVPEPEHPWIKHIGKFGMLILREYWGQGLGTRLLEILDDQTQAARVTRIEASVRTQNTRALALYEHFGFQIEGTRRQAALINGKFEDEHLISKVIGSEVGVNAYL